MKLRHINIIPQLIVEVNAPYSKSNGYPVHATLGIYTVIKEQDEHYALLPSRFKASS